jgi:hypothetical protein
MANKTKPRLHGGRHVYRFYSKKNNAVNVLESYLELTYARIFSCDPNIKSFGSQTETMHCEYDGKRSRYTPDFLVNYIDETAVFVEVHPKEFIDDEFERRISHFNTYSLAESGIPILIKTDEGLDQMMRVNYGLISSESLETLDRDILTRDLPASLSLLDLIRHVSTYKNNAVGLAYTLIAHGYYEFDMTKLLIADTQLIKIS